MKCFEYSSLSWEKSVPANDPAIKWAKAEICVYADSVLCVGQMKDTPKAVERWKEQVEGLSLYSSYQDAVGIDGEAIEFEWTIFQDFHHCLFLKKFNQTWRSDTSSKRSSQTGASSCQCSMTMSGTRMVRLVFRMPKKSRITQ